MNLKTSIKHNPVAAFIVLYLALNFAAFLLPVEGESAYIVLLTLMVLIPTLVALALVAFIEGRRAALTFLRQSFQWRSPLKWYLIAMALGFVIILGGSFVALFAGRISVIDLAPPTVFLVILIPWALFEEIGLRGFALNRLLDRHSAFTAALIVGIPWALIHFGLIVLHPPDGRSALAEGLSVLVIAIPHAWVFVRSGRSVLVATALHWVYNVSGSVAGPYRALPEAEAFWYTLVSTCLISAVLVMLDWRMWFARPAENVPGEALPSAA